MVPPGGCATPPLWVGDEWIFCWNGPVAACPIAETALRGLRDGLAQGGKGGPLLDLKVRPPVFVGDFLYKLLELLRHPRAAIGGGTPPTPTWPLGQARPSWRWPPDW